MYVVKVFNDKQESCVFECSSFSEVYDNSVKRKSLMFINKSDNLNDFISNLSVLEDCPVASIQIFFDNIEIVNYTNYSEYNRASIDYPENNPNDAQGVVHFLV